MGIDWYRMHPKQGIPRAVLVSLRDQQAAAFSACGFGRSTWMDNAGFGRLVPPWDHPLHEDYLQSSRELKSYLDIPQWYAGMEFAPSFRVYPVTSIPIFPFEWQEAAHRTFLPDELPEQLTYWHKHIALVREGYYRAYLLQRYLYEMGLYLYREWHDLLERAEETRHRTNAWAKKPVFLSTRDEIVKLPPPTLPCVPLWIYWRNRPDSPVDDLLEHYEEQRAYHRLLMQMMRAWDRRVPGTWKIHRYHAEPYQSFDAFVAYTADSWVDEFFAWAGRCCDEQMGLFLDY